METFGTEESIVRGPYCGDCICMCFRCDCGSDPDPTRSANAKAELGTYNFDYRTNTPYA